MTPQKEPNERAPARAAADGSSRGVAAATGGPACDAPAHTRARVAWAALLFALAAVVFLWEPIASFDDGWYTPADLSQAHALTRVESGVRAGNVVESDTWTQFTPWAMFARDEVHRGRLPVWNAWNGGGVPHLANYQSAVLSPFTWPYYVLGFRLALIVAAFLKLWVLGFATYLFLRELRLAWGASVCGAFVYMFAGHQVLTLGYPHAGVAAALPLALFALERLARRCECSLASGVPDCRSWTARLMFPRYAGALALLAGAVVFAVLAGHPETLYFVAAATVVYALVRVIVSWRTARRSAPNAVVLPQLGVLAVHVTAVGVLAAGACAIQILPFLEYLANSTAIVTRTSGHQTPLPVAAWPVAAFPNLLGSPASNYFVDDTLPKPGYESVNLAYVGVLALFLAAAAPFVARRRALAIAFVAAAIAWIAYAYDVLGFARLLALVPTVDVAPMNRSQIVFALCVAVAAACTLDASDASGRPRRASRALGLFVVGIVAFWLVRQNAFEVANLAKMLFPSGPKRDLIAGGSLAHVEAITVTFLLGLGAFAWGSLAPRGPRRALAVALVGLALFAQSGWLFRHYHTVAPDKFFYPRTQALNDLLARIGDAEFVVVGSDGLPPATNVVYGVRQLANYDALSIRRHDLLYRAVFGDGGNWREIHHGTTRGLQLFGVDYVLASGPRPPFDTAFGSAKLAPGAELESAPVASGAEFTQEFRGLRDGLEGVTFAWTADGPVGFEVALTDVDDARELAKIVVRERSPVNGARSITDVPCPRQERSRGRLYRLDVRPLAGESSGMGPRLVLRRDLIAWIDATNDAAEGDVRRDAGAPHHPATLAWQARQGDANVGAQLALDLHHSTSRFEAAGEYAGLRAWRYLDAVPRWHLVEHVEVAADDRVGFRRVQDPEFDPRDGVVLEGADARCATDPSLPRVRVPTAAVRVEDEDHGHHRLATSHARASWLVTPIPWYPGWTATIDGVPARVECANYAFTAVSVPAGAHRIEFAYAPKSVRKGAWLSLASLLVLGAWLGGSTFFARRSTRGDAALRRA